MSDTQIDRTAWITARTEAGYDWSALMRALSELVIYGGEDGHGVIVDTSAIAPENAPTEWWLKPGPDGWWHHSPSNTSGPLAECLASIALTCIEPDGWEPTRE